MCVDQGQIIRVEDISAPVLVVSKKYYNTTGQILGCPIVSDLSENAIKIKIVTERVCGTVLCDQIKNIDLQTRGYQILGEITLSEKMLISDVIQGLIEY